MRGEHVMRAKMCATAVGECCGYQEVILMAVCRNEGYPEDGSDENNTFAMFTPQAELQMTINNPALNGKIKQGDEFYVDFTRA